TIAACFAYEIFLSRPEWSGVAHGLIVPRLPNRGALLVSVGIIGATVMPHNLYLHSSLVQTRAFDSDEAGKKEAVRSSTLDTIVALGFAFFVNAAILVLSAAVFHKAGFVVKELQAAPNLLRP